MRRVQPRRLAALGLTVTVLVTGCSRGSGNDNRSSLAPVPTSSVPTTTPSTSATTTPGPGSGTGSGATGREGSSGCPSRDPLPPAGATEVNEVGADVDGDGQVDRVLGYRQPDGSGRVAVELAAGGTAAVSAGGTDGAEPLSVLGGVALGGDGETVLAVIGAGASVTVVGLFQFVECAVTLVSLPSGQPAELPVGGAITHGDGLACTGGAEGRLVHLSATSTDGDTFTTDDTAYRVDANTAIEVNSEGETLTSGADGAEIQRHYTLDCPGLQRGLGG
ncbi:MAG: hypothetical protein ACR2G7_01535 [Acidimicrobiales bacterium]